MVILPVTPQGLSKHLLYAFPHSSVGKASARSAGDLGSIPGSGRSPGEGNGNPFQYGGLENPMDRGAWWAPVHGVPRAGHDLATTALPTTASSVCQHSAGKRGTIESNITSDSKVSQTPEPQHTQIGRYVSQPVEGPRSPRRSLPTPVRPPH